MNWLNWLQRSRIGIFVLTWVICLAGVWSMFHFHSSLYPDVVFPRAVVVVNVPSESAATLEVTGTRPVEQALMGVVGVRRVRARTIRSAAEISVWFDADADPDVVFQRLNTKLGEVRNELPKSAKLAAEKLTPSSFPMITLAVTGTASSVVLKEYALRTLRPRLAGLEGTGVIGIVGGDTREIEVLVDPLRLQSSGLGLQEVAEQVAQALPRETAGKVDLYHQQHLIVVGSEATNIEQLGHLRIGGSSPVPLRLQDVAQIVEGTEDRVLLATANGKPAVLVNVGRRPNSDAVAFVHSVNAEVERLKKDAPLGIEVIVTYDQATLIERSVANVRDAVLVGALMTLLIIGYFLRSKRAFGIAACTLPVTVLATFASMRWVGMSLNLMSLGGLAISIGLVVDDAVVVVEAIHTRVSLGMEIGEACASALKAVLWPVINSTLSTVIVFAPLSLLSGVTGQFFSALALTLCLAVLWSLVVSLTLTPLMCFVWLKPLPTEHSIALQNRYEKWLQAITLHPKRTAVWTGVGLVLLLAVGSRVGTSFLPDLDEGAFVVDYFTPTGTSLDEANRLSEKIENALAQMKDVATTSRRLGAELGPLAATLASRGDITVTLKSHGRESQEDVIEQARDRVAKVAPGVRVEFIEMLEDMLSDLEGNPEPIEVKLLGHDVEQLRSFAPTVAEGLRSIPGLVDLYDGVAGCVHELKVALKPVEAGRAGLRAQDISDQIRMSLLGEVVTTVPREDRLLGVRVRWPDQARYQPDVLNTLQLRTADKTLVPLTSIATVSSECVPAERLSENMRSFVSVTGRLEGRDLGSVTAEVNERLKKLTPPRGVEMTLGGQSASQRTSFVSLLEVLFLAVLGVFVVLVFHFRSSVMALLILAMLPVAIGAGAATLTVTQTHLNVSSLMGFVLLVGLSLKNGLLLLDHAQVQRSEGLGALEAIRDAGKVRLRPILMTTSATVLGLLPLALGWGTGAELQRPLAIAVLGGLIISTAGVLFVLPALYLALDRLHSASKSR